MRFALLLLPVLALAACGGEDAPRPNSAPTVELTSDPMDGEPTSWRARFHWHGIDPDGYVARYQVAIDVPEGLLGSVNEPGDTGIAWQETTALEGTYEFSTPVPGPPVDPGGVPDRHFGDHNIFVRAIDDEGAVSVADGVEFTAFNLVPRTRITLPGAVEGKDLIVAGRTLRVAWEVDDPDDERVGEAPLQYEWKLKKMPIAWFAPGQRMQTAVDLLASDATWNPLPAGTRELLLEFETPHPYIFAVRTVDRGGAVERLFVKGRNGLILQALDGNGGAPYLYVRNQIMGEVHFPTPARFDFETATEAVHRFEMSADADAYGGVIQDFSYGVNIVPDDDSDPGWSAWAPVRVTPPIRFGSPGIHTVSFRVRDTGGVITRGTIAARVVSLSFRGDVLYVDDVRRAISQGISDAATDSRHRAMLGAAGVDVMNPSRFRQFDAWGSDDASLEPAPLRLEEMGAFKMVLWDTWSSAVNRNSLLLRSNACATNRILQAYVAAGGGLWVWGQQAFGGFDLAEGSTCFANLSYALDGGIALSFGPGDFLYEYMGLGGGGIQNVRSTLDVHGLVRLEPADAARADGILTPIGIDRAFYPGTTPINFGDVMTEPVFNASGGLDSLFTYGAAQGASAVNRRPNAFRYADPDPVPDQGPVAVFGFPLHVFEQGSAAEKTGTFGVAATMIDWLRRHHEEFVATRGSEPRPAGGS